MEKSAQATKCVHHAVHSAIRHAVPPRKAAVQRIVVQRIAAQRIAAQIIAVQITPRNK